MGTDENGADYFTMKRVMGSTLEHVLEEVRRAGHDLPRRHSQRRLLSAFANVCLAVHYAHSRGVVHRDLKPSNIMLGEFGEVYVMDWGLAKFTEIPEELEEGEGDSFCDENAQATRTGDILGTLGYMAPEQARGAIAEQGPACDVYALGAILFEIVALEPLHQGNTGISLLESTLRTVNDGEPRRAQTQAIPSVIEDLVHRATEPDWRRRVLSARDLAEGVEAFLDDVRDIQKQKQLADTLAQRAAEGSARAASPHAPLEARTEVLREGARALALDPTNTDAAAAVVNLLEAPPDALPEEVVRELDRASAIDIQRILRMGSVVHLLGGGMGGALVGFLTWRGIPFANPLPLFALTWGITGLLLGWLVNRTKVSTVEVLAAAGMSLASVYALAAATVAYSPLALIHICSLVIVVGRFTSQRWWSWWPLMLALAALVVPLERVMELLGVQANTLIFNGGSEPFFMRPNLPLPQDRGGLDLLGMILCALCVTICGAMGRAIGRLSHKDRTRSLTLTWHLRHLLPSDQVAQRLTLGSTPPSAQEPGRPQKA
jgi:serine/threonine-protein kinase